MESKYAEMLSKVTEAPLSDDFQRVFTGDGVLVALKIKRWRGKAKLESTELGLQQEELPSFDDFMNEYVSLGQKLLMPRDYNERLAAVEVSARNALKEYSYKSPWGDFVPFSSFDTVMDMIEASKAKFFELREEIDIEYDNILSTIEQDYAKLAGAVYRKTHGIEMTNVGVRVPRTFVDSFLQSILDQVPPREAVYDSFIYETKISSLPDLLMGMPTAEETKAIVESVELEGMEAGGLHMDAEPLRTKDDIRASMREEVRRTVLGTEGENLDSFIDTVLSRMREVAKDGSERVIASIDNNGGKLVGKAAVRARNLVEKLRALDFYGDAKLMRYVDELDAMLRTPPKKRDVALIRKTFAVMGDYSRDSLAELGSVRTASAVPGSAVTLRPPVGGGRTASAEPSGAVSIAAADGGREVPALDSGGRSD